MLDAGRDRRQDPLRNYCCPRQSYNAIGPVHNPHKMGYSAGAPVGQRGVWRSVGRYGDRRDQGDDPDAVVISGTYGMKPTWGLVPYTGIMPIEIVVDHTGPMTANVADNALLLEIIAGDDGYDPRIKSPKVQPYTKALGSGIKGLKIAVVEEGFQQPGAEADVNESVRDAAKRLRGLGATVDSVSIPMHLSGLPIWTPTARA